jgi:hypothetical protein
MTRKSQQRYNAAIDSGRDPHTPGRPSLLNQSEDKYLENLLIADAKAGIHYDYEGIANQV